MAGFQVINEDTVLVWNTSQRLSRVQLNKLPTDERHHVLHMDDETFFFVQAPERYMNHSCAPNTQVVGHSDVAVAPIEAGDEITSDYGEHSFVSFECHCGAKSCRGTIRAKL